MAMTASLKKASRSRPRPSSHSGSIGCPSLTTSLTASNVAVRMRPNGSGSPAAPRVRSARSERRRITRACVRTRFARLTHPRYPFATGCAVRNSRGAVWCSRMLCGPAMEPGRRRNAHGSPTYRTTRSGAGLAPHARQNEPTAANCATGGSRDAPPIEETTLDETDTAVPQAARIFEGARSVPTETAKRARAGDEPERCNEARERSETLCPSV